MNCGFSLQPDRNIWEHIPDRQLCLEGNEIFWIKIWPWLQCSTIHIYNVSQRHCTNHDIVSRSTWRSRAPNGFSSNLHSWLSWTFYIKSQTFRHPRHRIPRTARNFEISQGFGERSFSYFQPSARSYIGSRSSKSRDSGSHWQWWLALSIRCIRMFFLKIFFFYLVFLVRSLDRIQVIQLYRCSTTWHTGCIAFAPQLRQ